MKSTERFSSRVEPYLRYRPRYPDTVLDILTEKGGLTMESVIADLGSGTGFLAESFLRHGNKVYGVEPNLEMRLAGEAFLAGFGEQFISVNATAEETTLPDDSIDLIVAGQAYHWFEVESTREECRRLLKPGGSVALIWNERRIDDDPFQGEYEKFLRTFGTDYVEIGFQHRVDERSFNRFFADGWWVEECPNEQRLEWEGLRGRLLSTSYSPQEGAPRFGEMMEALKRLYEKYREEDGTVCLRYRTRIYWGGV